jgi:hypothetical protein
MKVFTLVFVILMLSGIAMAGGEVPMSMGDKAMVFMFDGLANLSIDGPHPAGFGMRYYISDGTAIRGLVIVDRYSHVDEADEEGYADDEHNYTGYGLAAVYEKHMESMCPSVAPYWGLGAGFEMASDEYVTATGPDGGTSTTTDKGTWFEVFGALGFEWAFTDCMTLGGEYQLGFWRGSGETELDSSSGSRSETYDKFSDTWIGFDTTSVFLSVYF